MIVCCLNSYYPILKDLESRHDFRTTILVFEPSNLRRDATRVSAVSHHVVSEQSSSKITVLMETNFREKDCIFDRRNRHPRSKLKHRLTEDKKDDVKTEIVEMHYERNDVVHFRRFRDKRRYRRSWEEETCRGRHNHRLTSISRVLRKMIVFFTFLLTIIMLNQNHRISCTPEDIQKIEVKRKRKSRKERRRTRRGRTIGNYASN